MVVGSITYSYDYQSPVTAGAVTPDFEGRFQAYEEPHATFFVTTEDEPARDRYPTPAKADLVTLWKRGREPVLSITADGKVHDFHLPPARLAVLLREVAEMISEHSILQ